MNLLNTSEIPANGNAASSNSFSIQQNDHSNSCSDSSLGLNLKSLSDKQVLNGFGSAIKSERKSTHEVLSYIIEMESRRLYMPSHTSLYNFMIEVHGYDRNAAWRRIAAARILMEVPVISEKVESGALSLTQLSQVRTAILAVEKTEARKMDISEKEELLAKVEGFTSEQTELILAQELDLPVKVENKKKIHRDESVTLTVTLTKEQMALLKQASDLISHAVPQGNWADVIAYLAQKEIARRTKVTRKSPTKPMGASVKSSAKSEESSAQERRASTKSRTSPQSQVKVGDVEQSQAKGADVEQSDIQSSSTVTASEQDLATHRSETQKPDTQNADAQASGPQQLDLQGAAAALVTRVEPHSDVQVTSRSPYNDKAENLSQQEVSRRIHVRKSISPNVRKEVLNRDRCCQFKDPKTGKICGDTRFPQVDHIQSIWAGGTNDPLNLQQLCAKHNQYKYRKEAGYSH